VKVKVKSNDYAQVTVKTICVSQTSLLTDTHGQTSITNISFN